MKTLLIIGSIAGLFILFQAYKIMGINKTELQPYKVLKTYDSIEIRFYPAVSMAMVKSNAQTYKELSSPGFRKLANYIFGGNNEEKQIAMTSPVHMDLNDSSSTMSFVMPASFNFDSLPKPQDNTVLLMKTKDEYVAAITFSGYINDSKIEEYKAKLIEELAKHSIKHFNNFRILGYDPPYQVIGRKNEIIVGIDSQEFKIN
jgi:hypothetical protein